MSETLQDDYRALADFAQNQEKTMIQNLISQEQQDPKYAIEPGQAEMVEKYKDYLTFKVYGKGAFGEVTEFYDIINREKVAKKVFTNITDYKVEKDVMTRIDEALGKQLSEDIILGVSKYDAKNQTIYYRAGNCNLADLCNQRREQNIYWFNNEKELLYIATTLFDYVIKMSDKNVYHSDLKPVNTCWIYNDKGIEQYDLKLIDMGGATFHWNYLVAITPTYFPEPDVFNANENQERRTKAEIYQVGRILQEVCLSSIYAKSHHIYCKTQYKKYKDFIKYYMQNIKQFKDESLQLIKDYYSEDIYQLVKNFLEYNERVESGKAKMNSLREKANKSFRDAADLIKLLESQKMNQMFESVKRSEDMLYQELDFYLQFDFDERGLQRVKDELKKRVKNSYRQKQFSKFPKLAFYEAIFYTRNQDYRQSDFIDYIIEWEQQDSNETQSESDDSQKDNDIEKSDKFLCWDRTYDDTDTIIIEKKNKNDDEDEDQVKLVFQSPQISDELKLQFFCEVVGKTAHFDYYLEKETIEKIITLLGFDDENSPYQDVISKYQKFFQKGSSQIYNDTLVKKTVKGLQSLIDESNTEEKKNIFRSFIFQIKCLFVEACYKQMEEAIKKKLDVLSNIDQAIKLFKEIKKSEYGKQMQFLLLVKGFYLLKKFEIENKQKEKSADEKQKLLTEIKETLKLCSKNMVKIGSPILKYEKELYLQLAKLSNQLDDEHDNIKYEYLAMQKEYEDYGNGVTWEKFKPYVVGKQWEKYGKLDDEGKKEMIINKIYKEYFEITDQWTGYLLAKKHHFLSLRARVYKKSVKWGEFEENTDKQRYALQGYQYNSGSEGPKDLFVMNTLQTKITYGSRFYDSLIQWFQEYIQREKDNDKDLFSQELNAYEKEKYFDIFSCDFKLDYIKLMVHQQIIENLKDMYDAIDYLRDKYIDYPIKQNDITLVELYLAAIEKNDKQYKKSLKELDKEEMTPSQNHQLQILNEYNQDKIQPNFIDLNPKYYKNWQCPNCEGDLKYFENKDYWETRQKYMKCASCNDSLNNIGDKYAYPCYGCECQKKWGDFCFNHCLKVAILKNGDIDFDKKSYSYYTSFYVCLKCITKKKSTTSCKECNTQLKKIHDPYNNSHFIDDESGFSCKKKSRNCTKERQKGVAYCCPNPKCISKPDDKSIEKYKQFEDKYTICIKCESDYQYSEYLEKTDPQEKAKFDQKKQNIEQMYEKIKDKAMIRRNIYLQRKFNYNGYDFQLCFDLFDNKYGEDWEKYYHKELQYKQNPSSRPKNIQYPLQQQQQQPQYQKNPQNQQQQKQQQPQYKRKQLSNQHQKQQRDESACCTIF